MGTLYTIAQAFLDLGVLIDAGIEEGLSPEEVQDLLRERFEALEGQFQDKAEALLKYCKEREGMAAIRKDEANRLLALSSSDTNTVARMKAYLLSQLVEIGAKKLETPSFKLTVAQNGGKDPLVLDCSPEELPEVFQVSRVVTKADADAIRAALAEGADLSFARLGERGVHLRVR